MFRDSYSLLLTVDSFITTILLNYYNNNHENQEKIKNTKQKLISILSCFLKKAHKIRLPLPSQTSIFTRANNSIPYTS